MHLLVAQAVWFGLAALIIFVDRKMVEAKADPAQPESIDLTDRGIGQYLLFMLLFGGFVIPFYMWNSRKSGAALGVGVALMLACGLIAGLVLQALAPAAHRF